MLQGISKGTKQKEATMRTTRKTLSYCFAMYMVHSLACTTYESAGNFSKKD